MMAKGDSIRVLVVDDDPDCLTIMKAFLRANGHQPEVLVCADEALETIERFRPDVVIVDIMMPGITGGGLYEMIRKRFGPGLPVIVSSGTSLRLKNNKDRLLAYCPKPVQGDSLIGALEQLIEIRDSRPIPPIKS